MIKGFKVRLFPTKQQEQLMWKHIGACRFVWNLMLETQIKRRQNGQKHMSRFDMTKYLTVVKHQDQYKWMNDVSCASLQIICMDLDRAYTIFFNKVSGFPKFKSRKKSEPRFPIGSDRLYFTEDVATIEKIGKIKYQTDYNIPYGRNCKFLNAKIAYINDKWILSFAMQCENQVRELTDKPMGIDLGIKQTAVISFGDEKIVFHNINKSKRVRNMERRLKHLQRNVARKYDAHKSYQKTSNIIKAEKKVRKAYYRLANIRHDYTHKCTHKLVELLPKKVIMEDLNVSGMMKDKHLSNSLSKQCFYQFIRQMKYKCQWNGIEFIQVPRFYPSSKTCSACGAIKKNLKLSDRTFVCDECGCTIDRDYNAANNLMRYAV